MKIYILTMYEAKTNDHYIDGAFKDLKDAMSRKESLEKENPDWYGSLSHVELK